MKSNKRITIAALLGGIALAMLLTPVTVPVAGSVVQKTPAATITVHSSADAGGTCPGADCTLRQAIATAAPGDTIDFDMTTVTSPITLASELAIDKDLQIQGPGASLLAISGNNAVRVFNIGGVIPAINVTISGLTIANGLNRGADGNPAGEPGFGGGILNDSTGTLNIINSVLSNNAATGGNAQISIGGYGRGGAIYNRSTGTLIITGSTLSGNTATGGNAGIGDGVGGLGAGKGGYGDGAGLYNESTGNVKIMNTTFSGNAAKGGSAINNSGDPGNLGGGSGGGAISNTVGTVTLTNSTLTGNSSALGDTQHAGSGGVNCTPGGGGTGLQTGATGGAINNGSGTININSCTVSGNSANGGIQGEPDAGNVITVTGSFGGGISNFTGTLNITNSTVFGNSVSTGTLFGTVVGVTSRGGGILNGEGIVNLTNSTIFGNSAAGGTASGCATAGTGEGGGVDNLTSAGTVNAKDTIISGNNVPADGLGPDFKGTLISQGWNLIGNSKDATITPTTGDQIGTDAMPIDPLLGPLADNGGPTMTLALLAGSPAIDKGAAATDPISGMPITTDQRGFPRPVDNPAIANATGGNGSDIGAFEAQNAACSTVVTSTNDSGAGSLREAVICSNLTPGTQTITFAAGVTGTITLTSGEMVIFDSVNIVGPGAGVLTVSGNNASRIFNIAPGNYDVSISGLTIANGLNRGINSATPTNGTGGGILNNSTGTLAINNVVISGNFAAGGDSVLNGRTEAAQGIGGGIYNANGGTLNITNSVISENVVRGGKGNSGNVLNQARVAGTSSGGGIANTNGTVNLTDCTIAGNTATNGDTVTAGSNSGGGGLFVVGSSGAGLSNASGNVNITNSTVSGNSANGGVYNVNDGNIYIATGGIGGGISNNTGTVRITNSTFFGNSANGLTISGISAVTVVPLFSLGGGISNGGQLILTNSTFSGNAAVGTPSFNGRPEQHR